MTAHFWTAHFWLAHPIEKVGWRGFGPCFSIGVECSFLSHADRSEAAAAEAGEKRGQWASHELPISIKLSGKHMYVVKNHILQSLCQT